MLLTKKDHASRITPPPLSSRSGIALVITLILLSVITFMAVTFLVITQGERKSVTTSMDQLTAKQSAESALELAKMAILGPMVGSNTLNTLGYFVSTNYINPNGFTPGDSTWLNVNYDYLTTGQVLTPADALQNLQNLRYLPRAPVFVTNSVYGSNEFRLAIDMNRNHKFDPTGMLTVTNSAGQPNTNVPPGFFWGDPQWIGILQRPGFPHSPSNYFVGRYAFLVVPSSDTLDLNNIHNYAKELSDNMSAGDGFLRNMGVSPFEMNLGAFFTDLNTNYWPPANGTTTWGQQYQYNPLSAGIANVGAGFDDAVALLRYRYDGYWNGGAANHPPGIASVRDLFGANVVFPFRNDYIDGYSAGPIMTAFHWPPVATAPDPESGPAIKRGWAGSENTNRFYDLQDLFDPAKSARGVTGFSIIDRLRAAGSSLDSNDRYTFYRMYAQLGTDSAPDTGKINPNYRNMTNGVIVPDMATNFLPWSAEEFVTNAAIRFLQESFSQQVTNAISTNFAIYTNFGQYAITNYLSNLLTTNPAGDVGMKIQIYPTNFYTPSVHRMLQLAANVYDASLNRTNFTAYPTVLRPLFYQAPGNYKSNSVFIIGYQEVTNNDMLVVGKIPLFHDLTDPNPTQVNTNDMVYGIPLVVGAKKGFPNFNELAMHTDVQVIRKLHFRKASTNAPVSITNQVFTLMISNAFKVEAWNSYVGSNLVRNPGKPLQVFARADVVLDMTNELGLIQTPFTVLSNIYVLPPPTNPSPYSITNFSLWEQWDGSAANESFKVPFQASFFFLTTNVNFSFEQNRFVVDPYPDTPNRFPTPHWWLNRRTRLQVAIVDNDVNPPRIIDYANLVSSEDPLNITGELTRDGGCENSGGTPNPNYVGYFFCTNRLGNPTDAPMNPDNAGLLTYGLKHQLSVSAGDEGDQTWWTAFGLGSLASQTAIFRARVNNTLQDTMDFNAPFTPFRVIHYYLSWQANDPLVHYTPADLTDLIGNRSGTNKVEFNDKAYRSTTPYATKNSPLNNIGIKNEHYRPWVREGSEMSYDVATDKALNLKDPMVEQSIDWDFPTNKFPNIGWLGRVHRGTAWQTVYMKSALTDRDNWVRWSGYTPITNWDGFGTVLFDEFWTYPTNDYRLFDLFTTTFSDNSSKGKLSVNQTNLAAWSAVLSGVNVTPTVGTNIFIQPAGIYDPTSSNKPPLVQILDGINNTRTNFPSGVFGHTGDILFTPQLTTNSPYIDKTDVNLVNDQVYERIPQQIMGLLRGGDQPRFVVYAFGQALKPAERSIMNNGAAFGLCTNYQVTAETAIRAVVRIDGSTDPAQANNADPTHRYPPRAVVESYNVLGPYY